MLKVVLITITIIHIKIKQICKCRTENQESQIKWDNHRMLARPTKSSFSKDRLFSKLILVIHYRTLSIFLSLQTWLTIWTEQVRTPKLISLKIILSKLYWIKHRNKSHSKMQTEKVSLQAEEVLWIDQECQL